jgi:S-adenosylhomocysteine hydrolase
VIDQPYEQKQVACAHEQNLPILDESHVKLGDDNRVGPGFGRILGIKRANFWLLAVTVVIIVVVVGGAVGGSLAGRKQGYVAAYES